MIVYRLLNPNEFVQLVVILSSKIEYHFDDQYTELVMRIFLLQAEMM